MDSFNQARIDPHRLRHDPHGHLYVPRPGFESRRGHVAYDSAVFGMKVWLAHTD